MNFETTEADNKFRGDELRDEVLNQCKTDDQRNAFLYITNCIEEYYFGQRKLNQTPQILKMKI